MNKQKTKRAGRPTTKKIKKMALKKAIDIVGGVTNLSLDIGVDHSLISKWLYGNSKIPAEYVIKIVAATKNKILADELRPDIQWHILTKQQL